MRIAGRRRRSTLGSSGSERVWEQTRQTARGPVLGWRDTGRGTRRLVERPVIAPDEIGSLATGHPFAATGARIVATLAKQLAQLDKPAGTARGLISICAAGGQGVVAILER